METLCAAIGLSLILIYLVTGLIYVSTSTSLSAAILLGTSTLSIALGLVSRKDMLRLFRSSRVKRAILGYIFLLAWVIVLLGMIRVYSGAGWHADWLEHFQRTLFFLARLPPTTLFANVYLLPARPPLMNVLGAYFLGQTADRFESFQIVFSFLNLLVFFSCCLIMPAIVGTRRTRILPLVALLAFNPVFIQNVTYPWTKALTAFFVVLGLALYLAAWRKDDPSRMMAAFVSLVAGMLVHYSAGPYLVFVTLHYVLWLFWRRPNRWSELWKIFVSCTLLLATWFAWSIVIYGSATFLANTSVTSSEAYAGSTIGKITGNIFDSIVPVFVRGQSLMRDFEQPNAMGKLRDTVFLFYQTNIIFGMGLIGGPVVLWLMYKRLWRIPRRRTQQQTFWISLIFFCTVLGIAVVGERDSLGVAHLTLLSLEVLGLTLLASALSRRRIIAGAILIGCLTDFSLGILLHAHVESLENDASELVFSGIEVSQSRISRSKPGPDSLSQAAWVNWLDKHQVALSERWLEELPQRNAKDPSFESSWPAAKASLLEIQNEDITAWGGWYSRHGGEIQYIGDHIAGKFGEVVPVSILLVLLLVLMIILVRRMPSVSRRGQRKPAHQRR
jgi:hypothetical protein